MDWSRVTELLHLKPRHYFAIALVTALLLFLPKAAQDVLGLSSLLTKTRGWVGGVFLVSTVLLITEGLVKTYGYVRIARKERADAKARVAVFATLSPRERAVMRRFVQTQSKTQYISFNSGLANGLENAKMIYRAASMSVYGERFAYNIQPWAWDHLNKHPEAVAARPGERDIKDPDDPEA